MLAIDFYVFGGSEKNGGGFEKNCFICQLSYSSVLVFVFAFRFELVVDVIWIFCFISFLISNCFIFGTIHCIGDATQDLKDLLISSGRSSFHACLIHRNTVIVHKPCVGCSKLHLLQLGRATDHEDHI